MRDLLKCSALDMVLEQGPGSQQDNGSNADLLIVHVAFQGQTCMSANNHVPQRTQREMQPDLA